MSSSKRIAFLSLPGLCTGDLWHTAAAALLLQQPHGPFPADIHYVVLITLPEDARPGTVNGRVTAMYEYLTNLVITCVVAKLPAAGPSADDEHCESSAARIDPRQLSKLLQVAQEAPTSNPGQTFQAIWNSSSPVQLLDSIPTSTDTDGHPYILPPIHHYAATPILANYFSRSPTETSSHLRRTMPGDLSPSSPIFQDAQQKVQHLRDLIAAKRQAAGPGFEQARAILFIYRVIDGASARSPKSDATRDEFVMNSHQNASNDLFDQVRRAALRHGLVTIRVPHGLPGESISPSGDLDLFDVRGDSPGLLKDKRFTAAFWAQVHDHAPEVFGAVGGRTGSLDIAAFMGVDCFEWDEPLLDEIYRGEAERRLSREHLEQQVPQHLRLLTQKSLMSIGLLDGDSFVEGGGYTRLDEELLEQWLAGGRDVFPELPTDGETRRNVQKICEEYLERDDVGLDTVARGLGF